MMIVSQKKTIEIHKNQNKYKYQWSLSDNDSG